MRRVRLQQLTERTTREVARLNPGSFAFVMATGIISNAFFLEGGRAIAGVLYVVNLVAFPFLAWGLTAAGLITQWPREARDTVAAA